VLEIIVV